MLRETYEDWRGMGNDLLPEIRGAFHAPVLVSPPAEWESAVHKIAYVGQETRDWGWTEHEATSYGLAWLSTDVEVLTLGDFVERAGSIGSLMNAYDQFQFAERYPLVHRSPFWRYFRYFKEAIARDGTETCAIFSDVIRCAANSDGYSLWSIPARDREPYLRWQTGLLRCELTILRPSVTLFVTGPNYDDYIRREFPESVFVALPGFGPRVLAKIEGTGLPGIVYRTYHPGYLNRHYKHAPFDAIIGDMRIQSRRWANG